MFRTILLLLAFTLTINISAQSFEGKIVYKVSYKSKTKGVTDAQLTSVMGSVQNYFIKGGKYRSESNGTFWQWQLYNNKDNKLYSKYSNSETILWDDGAENLEQNTKTEINTGVGKILGYDVDEIVLNYKNSVEKHYVSSKLSVDPKLYTNHKYGNWHHLISQLKALPLKFVVDNEQFTLESVAIEVKELELEDKLFELPANAQTAKRPSN